MSTPQPPTDAGESSPPHPSPAGPPPPTPTYAGAEPGPPPPLPSPEHVPLGEPVYAWAPPEPARRRRRGLWWGIGLGAAALVLVGGGVAAYVVWSTAQAEERLAAAQALSEREQTVVQDAVTRSAETAALVVEGTRAYRDAAERWSASEAAVAQWQGETEAPVVEEPNPGGAGFPDGDADERALLNGIGAGDVQLIFDAGPQNCGYDAGGFGFLSIGGCYNPSFRDWLFLAWDRGISDEQIWPIFVHEAMHWQQWDRYAVLFESASRAGVDADRYRGFIESDASCRAVYLHGVPRSAFAGSSAPCDVTDWSDGWLRDRIAELGVPVAAPDPEAFEVQAVVRP